jgi:hypothetical protein
MPICSRCRAVVIDGGGTLKPEQGELRRLLRRRVVLLCVGCQEDFLGWLLEPHELRDVLSPMPASAGV